MRRMKGMELIVFALSMVCMSPFSFIILVLIGLYVQRNKTPTPEKEAPAKLHVDDLMAVLRKWGYSKGDATTMVQAAIMNNPESGFEDLLRYSLNGNKEK